MLIVFNSFLLVALTEMGDKTQILAFILATRFRKPWTIMAAILIATIVNHFLAATFGSWVSHHVPALYLKWGLGLIFIAFAIWIMIPDKMDDKTEDDNLGAFMTTLITFFIAEIGDKTQLSTVALAAEYGNVMLVTIGTTLGMLFSDGLAVFFGERVTKIIPLKWIHIFAAVVFVIFGVGIIVGF